MQTLSTLVALQSARLFFFLFQQYFAAAIKKPKHLVHHPRTGKTQTQYKIVLFQQRLTIKVPVDMSNAEDSPSRQVRNAQLQIPSPIITRRTRTAST